MTTQITKVEASISDQFDYVSSVTESLSGIIELLYPLAWDAPLYDDSKPSYNLSFNSKTDTEAGTLAGKFTIKHKATGDYVDSGSHEDEVENGTLSDSVTASYGTLDKVTGNISTSYTTKLNKDEEVVSSKHTSNSKLAITSSNYTLEDKSDDYSQTTSSSSSSSYVAKTNKTTSTSKSSDVYKSKDLNYSVSHNSKSEYSEGESYTSSHSGTGKVIYSNHDVDTESTITANLVCDYSSKDGIDTSSSSINFSSADIKITADDKSSLSSLSFSGSMLYDDNDGTSISLKGFALETADLKLSSTAVSGINDSESDVSLSDVFYGFGFNDFEISGFAQPSEETLTNAIDAFLYANQGDGTYTIKSTEGLEIDAGDGVDVVVGGDGADSITGGAGSDKLTGGKEVDTFSFNSSDFFTEDTDGNLVFNKSVDSITDFNLTEGDVLDLGDLGELDFSYNSLTAAQTGDAQLFYFGGTIYLNTDTTGEKYTATPIIKLTGNPAVNAELTDFNYPVAA